MPRGDKGERTNPFRYGALALDEAFADRERELKELVGDVRNGQDVVIIAPRRFGKSSLVWRAARSLSRSRVLVAHVDLMTTPNKQKLAEKLADAIYGDIASVLDRARESALAPFRNLRIQPTVTVDPLDGSLSFTFGVARRAADIDATLERLLALPAELGAARGRRVALVLDEFQEIVEIDRDLPKLMRSVFQTQPEVAHVYLGSRRHVMKRIFNDENEPFWRSAKAVELGPIEPGRFANFLVERFGSTGRALDPHTALELVERTGGIRTQPKNSPTSPGSRRRLARPPVRWSSSGRSLPSCAPSTHISLCSGTARRPRSGSCWRRWRASSQDTR